MVNLIQSIHCKQNGQYQHHWRMLVEIEKMRVLLIDGRTLYRQAVHAILSAEDGIEVIDEVEQDDGAFSQFEAMSPDLVIVAAKPPIVNSLKLIREIKRHSPAVAVILLGEPEDEELLFLGIKAGVAAYITNDVTRQELIDTVRRTFAGEDLINEILLSRPNVASRILKQFQEFPDFPLVLKEEEPLLSPLTHREIEILDCIAQGNSNRDIANNFCISEQTVKNHITSILRKLVANDRTHAVVLALRQGLIRLDSLVSAGAKIQNKAVLRANPSKGGDAKLRV
jgi:DNA-binding NarL/FixJ family response regulator